MFIICSFLFTPLINGGTPSLTGRTYIKTFIVPGQLLKYTSKYQTFGNSCDFKLKIKLVIGNKSGFSFCWKVWKNLLCARLLLPFILHFLLLAKVIFTFHLVSPLIGKGGYYLSSCIFHLIGKGDYYLSSCISSYWQR